MRRLRTVNRRGRLAEQRAAQNKASGHAAGSAEGIDVEPGRSQASLKDDFMQFQFNSGSRVTGDSAVAERVEALVRGRLERVADRLTRVEVHVSDVNGPRGGNDIRCAVELRPNGMKPVAATDEACSVETAVASATDKALSAFGRQIGKQTSRKGH